MCIGRWVAKILHEPSTLHVDNGQLSTVLTDGYAFFIYVSCTAVSNIQSKWNHEEASIDNNSIKQHLHVMMAAILCSTL